MLTPQYIFPAMCLLIPSFLQYVPNINVTI